MISSEFSFCSFLKSFSFLLKKGLEDFPLLLSICLNFLDMRATSSSVPSSDSSSVDDSESAFSTLAFPFLRELYSALVSSEHRALFPLFLIICFEDR